jgi:hypothetical protein
VSPKDLFNLTVCRKAARRGLGINQLAVCDDVELAGFTGLNPRLSMKLLSD